jgi:hypothetical protein
MIHPALTHTGPTGTHADPHGPSDPEPNDGRQVIVGVSKTAFVLATPGCLD